MIKQIITSIVAIASLCSFKAVPIEKFAAMEEMERWDYIDSMISNIDQNIYSLYEVYYADKGIDCYEEARIDYLKMLVKYASIDKSLSEVRKKMYEKEDFDQLYGE